MFVSYVDEYESWNFEDLCFMVFIDLKQVSWHFWAVSSSFVQFWNFVKLFVKVWEKDVFEFQMLQEKLTFQLNFSVLSQHTLSASKATVVASTHGIYTFFGTDRDSLLNAHVDQSWKFIFVHFNRCLNILPSSLVLVPVVIVSKRWWFVMYELMISHLVCVSREWDIEFHRSFRRNFCRNSPLFFYFFFFLLTNFLNLWAKKKEEKSFSLMTRLLNPFKRLFWA